MGNRIVYYTNESFAHRVLGEVVYTLAKITENEPGYVAYTTSTDLGGLQEAADKLNGAAGHDRDAVLAVVFSSMNVSSSI